MADIFSDISKYGVVETIFSYIWLDNPEVPTEGH